MTDKQLLTLLSSIRTLAQVPYPFADNAKNERFLIMALGEIAGCATRALDEFWSIRSRAEQLAARKEGWA